MKNARWLLILLVVISLVLIIAGAILDWEPWRGFHEYGSQWGDDTDFPPRRYTSLISPAIMTITGILTTFLFGIIAIFALPEKIKSLNSALTSPLKRLAQMTLLGFLVALLGSALAVSAAVTTGTFPITIILGLALVFSSILGYVGILYTAGKVLLARADMGHLHPFYGLFLGIFILQPISLIPYVGAVLQFLVISLGIGVVITTRFGTNKPWTIEPLLED